MGKAGEVSGWSAWYPLVGLPVISAEVLAETLDGGQAFRWHRVASHQEFDGEPSADSITWQGQWAEHLVRVRLGVGERVEWSAPAVQVTKTAAALHHYLGADSDFDLLVDRLPWRSDAHLARCVTAFSGLRILRQPFGETLLGFLCSATKQIVQIKQMVALLAERHGAPIATGAVLQPRTTTERFFRLPSWAELALVPEADLRACLLGFRARYIAETARFIAAHPGWLDETECAPYALAKERLCSLPGVGEKVADCVLLFGAGRLEAFPVDVWILKTLARRYGLEDWRPAQLAQFGRVHFGPLAGLAQQFLFAWERREGRKPTPDAATKRPIISRAGSTPLRIPRVRR